MSPTYMMNSVAPTNHHRWLAFDPIWCLSMVFGRQPRQYFAPTSSVNKAAPHNTTGTRATTVRLGRVALRVRLPTQWHCRFRQAKRREAPNIDMNLSTLRRRTRFRVCPPQSGHASEAKPAWRCSPANGGIEEKITDDGSWVGLTDIS